jgi:hypothetical protein
MELRDHILVFLLWLSVIAQSIWIGGTLYQMLVIVPMWSASPPESVRAFFQNTNYNRLIFRFFGPPLMVARTLPAVLALIAGWHHLHHRGPLILAVSCLLFGVVYTLAYVYPINAVLFEKAGGNESDDEISAMATRWIQADQLRFVVGSVAFLAILWTFSLPIPMGPE